jgi:hypothetical protein
MILLMAIPCVGILTLRIPTDNGLQIVLYSIKLIADCHISHSICTKLTYMDYLYEQSWHIWTTYNDFWRQMVPVMAIPCVFILADYFRNWFHYNSSRNASNCWRIVILCILYAWHLYIFDFDTNFWLYIIPFMAIPCIGILTLRISNKKCTQNSLVLHQIDSRLSYFLFYMHRVGMYGLLIMTLGGGWYQ